MKSYQNLALLQNLYRLKAVGSQYCDPIIINRRNNALALASTLPELHQTISTCHLCDLSKRRRAALTGSGCVESKILFVDSFVSDAEDSSGKYFVGYSGKMLSNMITNVLGLNLDDIYITHAVKCKTSSMDRPSTSQINSCKPYWLQQLEIISPKIVVALGEDALDILSGGEIDFKQSRGEFVPYGEARLIAIYHPKNIIQNPSLKRSAFADLKKIKEQL